MSWVSVALLSGAGLAMAAPWLSDYSTLSRILQARLDSKFGASQSARRECQVRLLCTFFLVCMPFTWVSLVFVFAAMKDVVPGTWGLWLTVFVLVSVGWRIVNRWLREPIDDLRAS